MPRPAVPGLVFLVLAAGGCSARWAYDTIRANHRETCFRYVDAQREQCLAAAEVTYDEYAAQR